MYPKHILIDCYRVVLYQFAAGSPKHSPTVTTKNRSPSVMANGRKQKYMEGPTYTEILLLWLCQSCILLAVGQLFGGHHEQALDSQKKRYC